ncbi:MAG: hypothetical protein V2A77_02295, partial [Pseudomonadota bacterium]
LKIGKRQRINPVLAQSAIVRGANPELLVKAYSLEEARESARCGADTVFYNIFATDFPVAEKWGEKASLGAFLPRIMDEAELGRAIELLSDRRPGSVLTGNLGFLAHRGNFKLPVYGDYSLNVFNDLDILFYKRFKVRPVLSPELSLGELADFRNRDAAILIHGDIVLVNTRICPETTRLADEKGLVFPVRQEDGYWQILNSRPFGVFNDIRRLRALGFSHFLIDREGEGPSLAALYRRMLNEDVPDRRLRKRTTSGHLYRPVG